MYKTKTYKTETEIFSQYEALEKTYNCFIDKTKEINALLKNTFYRSITFIGCGSSFSLCKSASVSAALRLRIPSYSIAAGDLMLNFEHYRELLRDTLLVVPSRSGSTTEVVEAVRKVKEAQNCCCISISAKKDAVISKLSDASIEIPWAFDEGVCQSRTVTNLYTANLLLIATICGDRMLLDEISASINSGNKYIDSCKDYLKAISSGTVWDKVVILADSELAGIAEEGALAFNEISMLHSNCYHILDVRHGPMVLINDRTLTIVVNSQYGYNIQKDLISDLRRRGSKVLTVSTEHENIWGSDFNVTVDEYKNYAVMGIPFIFVPQALAFYRAIQDGINPDKPDGLDPWIKLDNIY